MLGDETTRKSAVFYANIGISALSIGMVFNDVTKKIKKLRKIATYPLTTFASAIITGYESAMAHLTLDDRPANLTLLNTVHTHIHDHFLNKEKLKKNIIDTFFASFSRQIKKIEKLDTNQEITADESKEDNLLQGVITGENLFFKKNKFFRAADRLFRRITGKEKTGPVRFVEFLLGTKLALISATTSTLLVNLNYLGKMIGGSLALLTHHFFGSPYLKEITAKAIPALLGSLFLYKEIVSLSAEYSINLINKSLFYPLFAGIALGMYDEIKPENLPNIGDFRIEDKHQKRGQSINEIFADCWYYSERRYSKYEKYFIHNQTPDNPEEIIAAILIKKPHAAKKFLEYHLAFHNLCKNYPPLEAVKFVLITARFFSLFAQALIANAVFDTSRLTASLTAPLMIHLGEKIRDAFHSQQLAPNEQNVLGPADRH